MNFLESDLSMLDKRTAEKFLPLVLVISIVRYILKKL